MQKELHAQTRLTLGIPLEFHLTIDRPGWIVGLHRLFKISFDCTFVIALLRQRSASRVGMSDVIHPQCAACKCHGTSFKEEGNALLRPCNGDTRIVKWW